MKLKNISTPLRWGNLSMLIYYWENSLCEEFPVFAKFLYPTEEESDRYPTSILSCDNFYKVKRNKDGSYYCFPKGFPNFRMTLTKRDIVYHDFDIQGFREELCNVFNLNPRYGDIDKWEKYITLGTWQPEKGVVVPVTLLMGNDGEKSYKTRIMERIVINRGMPEIVLICNRDAWNNNTSQLAIEHKILMVPFDEIMEEIDGKIVATNEWSDYLATFRQTICPENLVSLPPYEFRKKGEIWVVRYEGKDAYLKDSVGARYLSQLFSRPNHSIYAVDLQLIGAGHDPEKAPPPDAGLELGDMTMLRDVETKSRELLVDLDKARSEGDTLCESEILSEIEELSEYLCRIKGFGGRLRKEKDSADSIRRSVQQGIKRAVEAVEDDLPEFAKHCRQTISYGFVVVYDPPKKPDWVI